MIGRIDSRHSQGVTYQERLNSPIAQPICTTTGSDMVSQPLLVRLRHIGSYWLHILVGPLHRGQCIGMDLNLQMGQCSCCLRFSTWRPVAELEDPVSYAKHGVLRDLGMEPTKHALAFHAFWFVFVTAIVRPKGFVGRSPGPGWN